ncbi:MAG: ATP-binding protein [Spirochaetota bacterium]
MKIFGFFNSFSDSFLEEYSGEDYITRQKARTLLYILFAIEFVLLPVFTVAEYIRYPAPINFLIPFITLFLIALIIIIFKKGHYTAAAHALIICIFAALWLINFIGSNDVNILSRMDNIMIILAAFTLPALIIDRRAGDIIIYFFVNLIFLILFFIQMKFVFNLPMDVITEYAVDSLCSLCFIGLTSYQIVVINMRALDSARHAEFTITAKNEELVSSNEEFESINNELRQSQQELIKSEEELRQSQERYKNIIESIEEGYFETDLYGRFIFANSALLKITGYTEDEVMDPDFRLYGSSDSDVEISSILMELYKAGKPADIIDFEITTKDDEKKIIEMSSNAIRDTYGAIVGSRGIIRDVTQKKKQMDEIFKIKKIESIGLLAGGIAHDFNNMLTAILGNLSLAKMNINPDDENCGIISDAEEAALRAKDLTQQLLTFSRGGAPVKKIASIQDLLTDTVKFVLRGSHIIPEFSIDENLYNAEIDTGQISQVIHNLVINSMQAMPDAGAIKLSAKNSRIANGEITSLPEGDYIKISITDEGDGIPEEILPYIFDPYFTSKENGTGLGLAITYSIIKKHGGYIIPESMPGNGTTFNIYLPASANTENLEKENNFSAVNRLYNANKKALIMDDELIVINTTSSMLKQLGFEVDHALNGEEAIAKYKNRYSSGNPFDLVIMDLTIPGSMGGKEAIKILTGFDPSVKAIVSSGYSNDPVMAEYKAHGFSGVIVKPYGVRDLAELIQNILI